MKMTTIEQLQRKWEQAKASPGGYLLVAEDHPLVFHIGYSDEGNQSFVILNTKGRPILPSTKAISVKMLKLPDGKQAIEFDLNEVTLSELFIKLTWDLIESSRTATKPLTTLLKQYKRWMRLLQQEAFSPLSSVAQKGLLGELLYLEQMIDEIGQSPALTSWVGPEGADQDFIFEDGWAEVKSVAPSSEVFKVSSLQQLDRDEEGLLVLFFIDSTTAYSSYSITLPQVIARITGGLTEESRNRLFCKLAMIGYMESDEEYYSDNRFIVSNKFVYRVNQDFPCLTVENVASQITSAQYTISISGIEPYRI